jgi:hypothetical protein
VTTALGLKENSENKSIDLTVDASSNTKYPSVKSVKDYVDLQVASSIATIVDASPTVKGKIQLSGDLTGTAALPAIANNAVTTTKIADGNITNAKLATGIDATKITGDIAGKASNVTGTVGVLNGGTGATSAAAARTNLGLVIGTDVQAPLSFTAPLVKNANTVSMSQATTSVDGYLSAADFASFNNKIDATQKAANNGVATLGNDGKIPSNQIPAISFQNVTVTNSSSAMTSISGAQVGSIAIRTDVSKNFVLSALPSSTLVNWIELATPSSVTSVNGFAGPNVVLTTNDVSEGANNKYYTDARVRSALSAASPLSFNSTTGTFSMSAASASNNGYLSASDFTTFNNKQNTLTAGTDYLAPNGSAIALTNFPTLNQSTTGNAATATKLAATKNINGVAFDGSASINIDADASTLTGNTLASNITSSSLTSVGTITTGVWSGTTIAIAKGGTGATTATGALTNLGAEPTANKSNDISGDAASTIKFPSVKAIKDYVDLQSANAGVADNSLTSAKINGTIAIPKGGTGATTAADARINLGLVIGTNVMAANATTTLTGDITGSGNGSFATTVNTVGGITAATIAGLPTSVAANTSSITANTIAINAEATTARAAELTLTNNVTANTASITSNTANIAANTESITANTTAINAEATTARAAELTLTNNVTANTSSITSNTASIAANTASITANTTAINTEATTARAAELTLTNNVTANTASIAANATSIAANTVSITFNTSSIAANTVSITFNTSSIAANTASITANTTAINAEATTARAAELTLTNNVTANTASITANTSSIAANTASITANTTSIASSTASITSNTSSIAANTASITANITAINAEATTARAAELTLTNNVTANTASITSNTANIAANTASITANTTAINTEATTARAAELTLTNNVTANTASITSNTANIAANTASITSNTTSIAANTVSITANTTAINTEATTARAAELTLTNNVTANTASITSNTASITANTASITSNTANITANTASITANTIAINAEATTARAAELTLTNNVTANTTSITANTTSIAANTASITANTTAINTEATTARAAELTLTNNVTANTASITSNTSSIAANTASITANTTAINTEATTARAAELTLTNNVTANTASITSNTANIAANTVSITSNTASIAANTASITANTTAINTKQNALTAGSGISINGGTISATGLTTANLSSTAGITVDQLATKTTTLGSTTMTLGGTVTSVTGLTSIGATNFIGSGSQLTGVPTNITYGEINVPERLNISAGFTNLVDIPLTSSGTYRITYIARVSVSTNETTAVLFLRNGSNNQVAGSEATPIYNLASVQVMSTMTKYVTISAAETYKFTAWVQEGVGTLQILNNGNGVSKVLWEKVQ